MPPPTTPRNARYRPTQEQTRDLVTWWAKRLNLHAWGIEVGFDDLSKGDYNAEAQFVAQGKLVRIVFDLKNGEFASPDDLEQTVIHELIHVVMRETTRTIKRLYSFAYGETSDIGQNFLIEFNLHVEDLCDHMAKVLIGMKNDSPQDR